jgi:probable FeS assembly SUF system protein SufT
MRAMEEVVTTRDVEAVVIPAGDRILIPEGVSVTITQALGGSYTVVTPHGYMARIAAEDGDAIGKESAAAPAGTKGGEGSPVPGSGPVDAKQVEALVWDELRTVYDPEIPINIVDLGLIYACRVAEGDTGKRIEVEMTMTAPGCGMGDVLKIEAEDKIRALPGVSDANVEIVWDPPWDQSRMSDAARLELGFG